MEQVIVADPVVIVTWDRNFWDRVWDDPLWAGVEAVREGQVYLSPTAPFGWIDRPPSLNRMIGLKWMAGLFYPDRWQGDLRVETRTSTGRGITSTWARRSWTGCRNGPRDGAG